MVLEDEKKYPGYNLPGGKLLWGEDVKECAVREFLEETGYKIKLTKLLGVFQRANVIDEIDYFRFIFVGEINNKSKKRPHDESVIKTAWVALKDLKSGKIKVINPQIIKEVETYFKEKYVDITTIGLYDW